MEEFTEIPNAITEFVKLVKTVTIVHKTVLVDSVSDLIYNTAVLVDQVEIQVQFNMRDLVQINTVSSMHFAIPAHLLLHRIAAATADVSLEKMSRIVQRIASALMMADVIGLRTKLAQIANLVGSRIPGAWRLGGFATRYL